MAQSHMKHLIANKPAWVQLRMLFACIWLLYDVLDVIMGATAMSTASQYRGLLLFVQLVLVIAQIAIVTNIQPRSMTALALCARGIEAYIFSLNDFLYLCVMTYLFVLAEYVPYLWWQKIAIWQTAWIYLATAILKINPPFLSGIDFFVRANYQVVSRAHLPYPAFYKQWIQSLAFNQYLAWGCVIAEMMLAVLLVILASRSTWRMRAGRWAVVLCCMIHIYAALTFNVWFFGASMIAQVGMLYHATVQAQ